MVADISGKLKKRELIDNHIRERKKRLLAGCCWDVLLQCEEVAIGPESGENIQQVGANLNGSGVSILGERMEWSNIHKDHRLDKMGTYRSHPKTTAGHPSLATVHLRGRIRCLSRHQIISTKSGGDMGLT